MTDQDSGTADATAESSFAAYLIENSKDIEPQYVRIVEENFDDLLA